MLKKRIIPCLDIKDGRTVKGVNFEDIRDAGDPIELAKRYVEEGADELVFLDITATNEKRKTLALLVEQIAKEINIPFTVGGGINSLTDAKTLINSGADKVSVNSASIKKPTLISELASELGSQCVVVAIDSKFENFNWKVYMNGGRFATDLNVIDWAKEVEYLGAGELLITSMNADGTKNGFDNSLYTYLCEAVNIPIIASGGAGKLEHFIDVFQQTKVSAALAASVFHYNEITIPNLKKQLKTVNIPVR